MASKLDEVISSAEQIAWLEGPLLDETLGTRPAPMLADSPYDDRLRLLTRSGEWPAFAAFLRSYIENGIPHPFDTQPGENRMGWWNFTIGEESSRVRVNVWRQYAADVDFRFDEKGELRSYGRVWIDKLTAEDAIGSGASLPRGFTLEPTSLKGRKQDLFMLVMNGPSFEETAEIFSLPWVVRSIRAANLDLMRGGQLSFGWQRFHVAKLLDAIFSEPLSPVNEAKFKLAMETAVLDQSLRTEIEATVWRRLNSHRFAEPVLRLANWKCAISGIEAVELLQACHVKTWMESSDAERLDPDNGLCLTAHLHAAFDAHLLGIAPDGLLVYSDRLTGRDRAKLGLNDGARIEVRPRHQPYLAHRFEQFRHAQPEPSSQENANGADGDRIEIVAPRQGG